jgi:undecaprenyl-diphosphatase
MTPLQALVLGILQGATEFLPVSSSGHLVLVPWLLNWHGVGESELAFDALVHWGTLSAVLAYFGRDLWQIVCAVWDGVRRRNPLGTLNARLGWYILVGSIPAALFGLLLEDWFEELFGRPDAAAILLFATAGLLFLSERYGTKNRELDSMRWLDAILIGLAQALAILPGISRSGATIAAALKQGLGRADAARYSFLLGVPAVLGAGGIQLIKLLEAGDLTGQIDTLLIGFLSAALVGYLSIHSLLLFVRRRPLYLFSLYCVALGASSLVIYVARA